MLTLVIPTYNRDKYLYRLLLFLHTSEFSPAILIPDSSRQEIQEKNVEIIKAFNVKGNIQHIPMETEIEITDKYIRALKAVKTKFVAFCADDDFVIPSTLNKCVQFLESNPDYTVAHGSYIGHQLSKGESGNVEIFFSTDYCNESLDHDHPTVRLCQHFRKYGATFYGVHRTKEMALSYQDTIEQLTDRLVHVQFQELFQSALMIIRGKVKSFPLFYNSRSKTFKTPGWEQNITRDDFSKNYVRFRNGLAKALPVGDGMTYEINQWTVDVCFSNYLQVGAIAPLPYPPQLKAYTHDIEKDISLLYDNHVTDITKQAGPEFKLLNQVTLKFPCELEFLPEAR